MKRVWAIVLLLFPLQFNLTGQVDGPTAEEFFQRSLREQLSADSLLAYGTALLGTQGEIKPVDEAIYVRLLMAEGYLGTRDLLLAEPLLLNCQKMIDRAKPGLLGYIHYDLGEIHRYKNEMELSLQHLDSAYTYSLLARDTLNITRVLGRMSVVHRKMGDPNNALEMGIRSLQAAQSTREPMLIAQANLSLGNVYFTVLKNYNKALELFSASLSICEEQGFHKKAIALLYNMGMVAIELESYEDAETYILRSAKIAEEHGLFRKQAHAYKGLGLMFKRQDMHEKALSEYHEALAIFNRMGNAADQAVINNYLASVHLANNDPDSSRHYAEISIELARKVGDMGTLRDAYMNLSNALLETGNVKDAFEHYRSARSYQDTLREKEYDETLLEMATRYETSEKERRLEKAQVELDKQKVVRAQRAFERNIMIATSVVLLLFIAVYYNVQQKKKRLAAQLNKAEIDDILKKQELKLLDASVEGQEHERQRIALDLHDRIGSLLSTVRIKFSTLIEGGADPADMKKALALLDRSVSEVRRISQDLASGTLMKFGLEGAVRDLVQSLEFADGIRFSVDIHGLEDRLPNEIERVIFRVVQESVSNALKHSKCDQIDIQINKLEGMVNVMVEDNGRGFDPMKFHLKGMGLNGMQALVERFNGTIHIDAVKGRGTNINCDIPIVARSEMEPVGRY